MELLSVLLFSLALSMDAFSVGIVYGIRRVQIPFISLLIISSMSAMVITFSMVAGHMVANNFSGAAARRLGAAVLLGIGLWMVVQSWQEARGRKERSDSPQDERFLMKLHIKSLGLVVQVIRKPYTADADRSGVISSKEAVLLGTALALDAFGAGFVVSMLGFNIPLTAAAVGVNHILLMTLGLILGRSAASTRIGYRAGALSGLIIVAMGLFKLCT